MKHVFIRAYDRIKVPLHTLVILLLFIPGNNYASTALPILLLLNGIYSYLKREKRRYYAFLIMFFISIFLRVLF